MSRSASPAAVRALVVGWGLRLAAGGVCIGLITGLALTSLTSRAEEPEDP